MQVQLFQKLQINLNISDAFSINYSSFAALNASICAPQDLTSSKLLMVFL